MKILACDNLPEIFFSEISQHLPEVEIENFGSFSEEELLPKVKNLDAIVVRSGTKITPAVILAAENLKVIGRAGVGVNNIDLQTAGENGIPVVNAPTGNLISVVELVFGMIISLARKIPEANSSMQLGQWEKKKFRGLELSGKKLGIIGFGNIGKLLAKRATVFEMEVLSFDPFLKSEEMNKFGVKKVEILDIASQCDFISVHVPLLPETKNLIGRDFLEKMKKSSFLINAARGGIVNEEVLIEFLKDKKISGAGIDTFNDEPKICSEFLKLENVILTPHIGGNTKDAGEKIGKQIAEQIIKVLQNKTADFVVNSRFLKN